MPEAPPRLIDLLLSDINAIVPNFVSLVSSYRLLAGTVEELSRTPVVPEDVIERALIRFDRTGTLIDLVIDILCCKIVFAEEVATVTCAPIDIFKLLADQCPAAANPGETAEQLLLLTVLSAAVSEYRYETGCGIPSCYYPIQLKIPEPKSDSAPEPQPPPPAPVARSRPHPPIRWSLPKLASRADAKKEKRGKGKPV